MSGNPHERDPRWQRAYGRYVASESPQWQNAYGAGTLFQIRNEAIDEMRRIEHAYEVNPDLMPPPSFELTPVHDPAVCRRRNLAPKLARAEARAAELRAMLASGKAQWRSHGDALRSLDRRIARLREAMA